MHFEHHFDFCSRELCSLFALVKMEGMEMMTDSHPTPGSTSTTLSLDTLISHSQYWLQL